MIAINTLGSTKYTRKGRLALHVNSWLVKLASVTPTSMHGKVFHLLSTSTGQIPISQAIDGGLVQNIACTLTCPSLDGGSLLLLCLPQDRAKCRAEVDAWSALHVNYPMHETIPHLLLIYYWCWKYRCQAVIQQHDKHEKSRDTRYYHIIQCQIQRVLSFYSKPRKVSEPEQLS